MREIFEHIRQEELEEMFESFPENIQICLSSDYLTPKDHIKAPLYEEYELKRDQLIEMCGNNIQLRRKVLVYLKHFFN